MKKIPTLFVRDEANRAHVTGTVAPGCEWVLDGEGVALRKYDGTCVKKDENDRWWARRTVKSNQKAPLDFVCEEFDKVTGHMVGWIPMETSQFARVFEEAREASPTPSVGTYELCGPTINGNPEGIEWPGLVFHKQAQRSWGLSGVPLTYERLRAFMTHSDFTWEGVVWHHRSNDGRMVKLKRKDFPPA